MVDPVYWIWLQEMFGMGTARSHQMMEEFSSPHELYQRLSEKDLASDFLGKQEQAKFENSLEHAKKIEQITRTKRCDCIAPDHPDYPPLLQHIYAKPAVLYVKGSLRCLQETMPIAMVGTRDYSEYGKEIAISFSEGLVPYGVTIVSGLAHGIDSFCHAGALEGGGQTIGVLACGLDIDYPKGNAALKTATCEKGAVISENPMGTLPKRHCFSPRNRIIAGISRGVVIIEAGETSGALLTANHALDAGREVFAVPGSVFSGKHVGSHQLIAQGKAKLVSSPRDILEEYPEYQNTKIEFERRIQGESLSKAPSKTPQKIARKILPEGMDELAQQVYAAVEEHRQTADQLASKTGLSISDVLSTITILEILGLVQSYPGSLFGLL